MIYCLNLSFHIFKYAVNNNNLSFITEYFVKRLHRYHSEKLPIEKNSIKLISEEISFMSLTL